MSRTYANFDGVEASTMLGAGCLIMLVNIGMWIGGIALAVYIAKRIWLGH